MDVNKIFSISALINGITAISFFVVALLGFKKNFSNKVFALFTFFIWLWSGGYFFWLNSQTYSQADFWVKILNIGSIFIPITYYHWITIILKKDRKRIVIIGYVITFLFLAASPTHLFYNGLVSKSGFNFWPIAGPLYIFYVIVLYGGLFLLGLFDITHSYLLEKNRQRKKMLKFVLLAYLISLVAGSSNFPLWFGIKIFPYGNFIVFVHIFLFSYAMMKYDLMNMKKLSIQLSISFISVVSFVELILSKTLQDVLLRLFLFLIMIFFFYLTIKTTDETSKQKEKLRVMAEKLKKTNRKLIQLDNAKNEFISIAAHQLRTPPTIIKGYASMALESGGKKMDEKTKDFLRRILESNERLIELVEDILDISRIESGKIKYNFEYNQDCGKIIDSLYKSFEIKAKEKRLKFILKKAKPPLPKTRMDSKRIREVLSNLIDNAIKYTPKGKVVIEEKNLGNKIRIEIHDTGVGISKKDLPELFKKFARGSSTERLGADGSGLGIYIGRKMIRVHHGKIWAESAGRDKGSTFILELPVIKDKKNEKNKNQ